MAATLLYADGRRAQMTCAMDAATHRRAFIVGSGGTIETEFLYHTSTQATVQQLMSLKPGDFIGLDLPETVVAKVDKVPVFECHYGVSSGHYAIKINEIVTNPHDVLNGASHE